MKDRITENVDVLLFNPPYVVTPSNEVNWTSISDAWKLYNVLLYFKIAGNGIEASWAGGKDGREVNVYQF